MKLALKKLFAMMRVEANRLILFIKKEVNIVIYRFYRIPGVSLSIIKRQLGDLWLPIWNNSEAVGSEWCYYVECDRPLSEDEKRQLRWLLAETFAPWGLQENQSFLKGNIIEIGPRFNFETAYSSTATAICHSCGLTSVKKLERSRRICFTGFMHFKDRDEATVRLHDRMTEMAYLEPPQALEFYEPPEPVKIIPVLEEGRVVLEQLNRDVGLAMDDQAIDWLMQIIYDTLKRNPTNVEVAQYAVANSEHSRHPFFNSQLVIDGKPMRFSLMDLVKANWLLDRGNSLVGFGDNSSAFRGRKKIDVIVPVLQGKPSPFVLTRRLYHPIHTEETHNHPTAVEPDQGAATGEGGRPRDQFGFGLAGTMISAGAGFATGNPHIPGFEQPWEANGWRHPDNLASPLDILIRGSNGAFFYGNCLGDPITHGFAMTYEMDLPDGYRAWYKPTMYTSGSGLADDRHVEKGQPEEGMLIIQIGGSKYRIGMFGGPASSMNAGDNAAELDFNSVQRGAPEMEQRVWRVVRACVNLGKANPVVSIHDLGAGGSLSALTEISTPHGGRIQLRAIKVGDKTLSVLEIWANESQEQMALLIRPKDWDFFKSICDRENCPAGIVGQITGDGYLVLHDESDGSDPVFIPLDTFLERLPRKVFKDRRIEPTLKPLELPGDITVRSALERVFHLISVGSKGWLTHKVDHSVSGLIAQQQYVGPHHLSLSDYAIDAHSHFELVGTAKSLGQQPIKGLISPKAMARLTVTEALLQLAGVKITSRDDINCGANWMWPAKEPGEAANIYAAAKETDRIMRYYDMRIDGGKDSLSMVSKGVAPGGTLAKVKAPGMLVIGAYVGTEDFTRKVGPNPRAGDLLFHVDLADGKRRLGGTALAQVYEQLGDECPDVEDPAQVARAFDVMQVLLDRQLISAVHDISDGGLITTVLEMAFAGNVGMELDINSEYDDIASCFAEEPGLVLACSKENKDAVLTAFGKGKIPISLLGQTHKRNWVGIRVNGSLVIDESRTSLRNLWLEASMHMELQQSNRQTVLDEYQQAMFDLTAEPPYRLSFVPKSSPSMDDWLRDRMGRPIKRPKVAIIREEGSNGDLEMAAAFKLAGFEPWDVMMSDLISGRINLDTFRGIAFVGGFSFADVLDAGKGWAGVIKFNDIAEQFDRFYKRPDTFSLGVCNGCQLMALLGWVPWYGIPEDKQPRFIQNASERFESRFPAVGILPSPSIMLKGMEESILGIWVAHGEGHLHVPEPAMLERIVADELAPIVYVDPSGEATEEYPFNPNGSPMGIAALTSPDGRHLAMMPHPERTFQLWQWPYLPDNWQGLQASPWLKMFQNALEWCQGKGH